jgi:hypothetical protein
MDTRTLDDTARLLLSGERGLLAMDESMPTPANVPAAQQALAHRAACNRATRRGRYDAALHAPAAN